MKTNTHHKSPIFLFMFFLCLIISSTTSFFYVQSEDQLQLLKNEFHEVKKIRTNLAEQNVDLRNQVDEEKSKHITSVKLSLVKIAIAENAKSDEIKKSKRDFKTKINTFKSEHRILVAQHQVSINQLKAQIDQGIEKLLTLSTVKNSVIEKKTLNIKNLDLKVSNLREQVSVLDAEIEELHRRYKKKITTLELSLFAIEEEQRASKRKPPLKERLSADGRVINTYASLNSNSVYINLGKKDRITNGMRFVVYEIGNGAVENIKGEIEVNHVDEHLSRCQIVSLTDSTNPILNRDLIANKTYHKNEYHHFFLIGKFKGYSHNEMRRLIEKNGGKVIDELKASSVDYVVVGDFDDAENDSQKKLHDKARHLHMNIMNEKEIKKYLIDYSR